MAVSHRFTSAKSDGGDATLVQPGDWNDPHEGALSAVNVVTDHLAAADGATDDTTEIHAARDAAGANGTLFFPEGTYLTTGLTASVDGQRWILAKGATIKLSDAAENEALEIPNGTDGFTIEGPGTIDGNRANQTTTTSAGIFVGNDVEDLLISGLRIIEAAGHGIRIKGATGVVNRRNNIIGCYIVGCDKNGLILQWEVEDSRIVGNYIADTTEDGIAVANSSHNTIISGNVIKNAAFIGIEIASASSTGCVVADNIVIDSGTMGISLGGANHNCSVTGNRVYSPASIGIELIGDGIACIGNTIKEAGSTGIARHDSYGVIKGNTIDSCGTNSATAAIKVNESAATSHLDNVIEGNTIKFPPTNPSGTLRGIWLQTNNASEVIRGTIIAGNRIIDDSTGGGTRSAIQLQNVTGTHEDTLIYGNIIDTGFTNRLLTSGTVTYKAFEVATAGTLKTVLDTDHTAAADPHTGYRLETADHTHASTGAQAGTLDHGTALTGLSDDDHPQYRLESESGTFTLSTTILAPAADAYIVWRAPFACTVTAIRGYVDAGTTTVINAFKGSVSSPTNFSTADLSITSATSWISDTTLDTTSVASGDAVGVEVVTVGTATEVTIQVDLTRP